MASILLNPKDDGKDYYRIPETMDLDQIFQNDDLAELYVLRVINKKGITTDILTNSTKHFQPDPVVSYFTYVQANDKCYWCDGEGEEMENPDYSCTNCEGVGYTKITEKISIVFKELN